MLRRLPAEWEEHESILLVWPHKGIDWASSLESVESVFVRIAVEISKREKCLIAADNRLHVIRKLREGKAVAENIRVLDMESNDVWVRDFGPITVLENGSPLLLDFAFNGWGLKFQADLDNQVSRRLHQRKAFGDTRMDTIGMVIEGGSIDSDGAGTLLTTSQCLLSANRNPHLSREAIQEALTAHLGTDRILWLDHGHLAGDDTDAHIDTLVRFTAEDTLVYVSCDDLEDEHHPALALMEQQLESFRTRDGTPYNLIPLPWPGAVYGDNGRRLPATYANFLILNNAVLAPIYGDPADEAALQVLQYVFQDREIVAVPCLPLIHEGGSLHCSTMQLPKGVSA